MSEYYIRYEKMGEDYYYMIYYRFLFFHSFYERWNSSKTAIMRLNDLNKTFV